FLYVYKHPQVNEDKLCKCFSGPAYRAGASLDFSASFRRLKFAYDTARRNLEMCKLRQKWRRQRT
ncbi:MAG: hypothetical protein DMG84_24270, partial [Acidobacteria bacterium]